MLAALLAFQLDVTPSMAATARDGSNPAAAVAVEVPLGVRNREAVVRVAEPVTSGVPFARGVLTDPTSVRLLRSGVELPSQVLRTASWPDGSVRWLLLDFQTDLPAGGNVDLLLQTGVAPAPVAGITFDNQATTLDVATGAATFHFAKSELLLSGQRWEATRAGTTYRAVPDAGGWTIEEAGPLKLVVRIEGRWFAGAAPLRDALIRFRARLVFHRNKSTFRAFLTFRNNNSFGWDPWVGPRQPDLILSALRCGVSLLPASGSWVFGSGVEKSWEVDFGSDGSAVRRETRYAADGTVAPGYDPPRPLALAPPAYLASTAVWGRFVPPLSGLPADRQADFDRFEKLQRAKVLAADVEDPPGLVGITVWQHLAQDLGSWNDYGDLRWGGDTGSLSGNHYDWSFGMYLQLLRTGELAFADLARLFAAHEIDLDLYHTLSDGEAFNGQKNWESRPSHDNPGIEFGGRPSHTWLQGYALHWLLTGDRRGLDAVEELREGIRQYLYESFNGEGYPATDELRIHGWLVENLLTLWRLDPSARLSTTLYGAKTLPAAMRDILQAVLDREAASGGAGFVFYGDPPNPRLRQPLQHLYFIEPAIEVLEEVFTLSDPAYAATLGGLVGRMSDWLISVTYGGETAGGLYRPRQIPYVVDLDQPVPTEGQVPYVLMSANAAAFRFLATGEERYRTYARRAFSDWIRYLGVIGGDTYGDPEARTATSYNSSIYVDTESKIHGWSTRYGRYVLLAESRSSLVADGFELGSLAAWSGAQGALPRPVLSEARPPRRRQGAAPAGTFTLLAPASPSASD